MGHDIRPSLKLLSSMAPRAVITAAIIEFRERNGNGELQAIDARAAGGIDVAKRVASGEAMDIVILAREAIDTLAATGHVIAPSRRNVMSSQVAVAVAHGAPRPSIDTEAELRAAVRNAPSIGYSTGPSGKYLESLFARWGLGGALVPRMVIAPPGIPVAQLVASGEADLGFQQLSELLNAPGIEVLGLLPTAIRHVTTFTAAICRTSMMPEEARVFIDFLASPRTGILKEKFGMASAAPSLTDP